MYFCTMKNNVQEAVNLGISLPIMEEFYTIQGEGFHSGSAAYFIRVGGCDVGCHWCDVKESWNALLHPPKTIDELLNNTRNASGTSRLVVITGGEPLMYDMNPLTKLLKKAGFSTNIETSGAYKLTGQWSWICLSPKKRKLPTQEIYQKANELKMIVFNKDDFRFAEEQAAKVSEECILFLQPEWSRKEKMIPLIVDYVKANPKWRISLQTHKYIDVP